jgi:hypothetical protein
MPRYKIHKKYFRSRDTDSYFCWMEVDETASVRSCPHNSLQLCPRCLLKRTFNLVDDGPCSKTLRSGSSSVCSSTTHPDSIDDDCQTVVGQHDQEDCMVVASVTRGDALMDYTPSKVTKCSSDSETLYIDAKLTAERELSLPEKCDSAPSTNDEDSALVLAAKETSATPPSSSGGAAAGGFRFRKPMSLRLSKSSGGTDVLPNVTQLTRNSINEANKQPLEKTESSVSAATTPGGTAASGGWFQSFFGRTPTAPVPAASKSSLLLRLFESNVFSMSIAIQYLFTAKDQGVLTYLGVFLAA